MKELRDYQLKSVADVRNAFRNGALAPLLVSPTGSGKTVIISHICNQLNNKGRRSLVLAHRQELVTQTSAALADNGIHHSICAANEVIRTATKFHLKETGRSFYRYESEIMVASIQTFVNRMADYPPFDFILIDEGHHAVAGTWMKVLNAYPSAKLLGFTATPERLDGKGLGKHCGGIYDALVIGPSVQSLIDRGYLTKPRVFAPPMQLDLKGIKTVAGDYDRKELGFRMEKPRIVGDVVEHYRKLCGGVPAIAFCATVEHAQKMAEAFREAGFQSACIDGKMDDFSRRQAIDDLGKGKINVLTSCEIVSEGTDIPRVGAAILLRKTKSLGLYLQQVGRALRPYPGKSETIILDHVGNCDMHGLPEEDRVWTLDGRKSNKSGNTGGNNSSIGGPAVRSCLKCYAVYSSALSACPICGTPAPKSRAEIEQIEGELIEYAKRTQRAEQGKARELEDLIKIGTNRGYKNPVAWAKHVISGRRQHG